MVGDANLGRDSDQQGTVVHASTDIKVNPILRFNYFSNPVDVEKCVNGTRKIGDVLRGRSIEDFQFREWFGGRDFRYVEPALPVDQSNDRLMGEPSHSEYYMALPWWMPCGQSSGSQLKGDGCYPSC